MPPASGRIVPQKSESPMPESGPMRDALTALMESASKPSSLAFRSSMAAVMPSTSGAMAGVTLKNSLWRSSAAAMSSLFG